MIIKITSKLKTRIRTAIKYVKRKKDEESQR